MLRQPHSQPTAYYSKRYYKVQYQLQAVYNAQAFWVLTWTKIKFMVCITTYMCWQYLLSNTTGSDLPYFFSHLCSVLLSWLWTDRRGGQWNVVLPKTLLTLWPNVPVIIRAKVKKCEQELHSLVHVFVCTSSLFALMMTGAFSWNVCKVFSKTQVGNKWPSTSLINAGDNWEATERNVVVFNCMHYI